MSALAGAARARGLALPDLRQLARFLVLGTLAAAVNWLVRFPLSLVLPFPAAVLAAYAVGMCAGFLLYRAYVFPASANPLDAQIRWFLIVNLFGAGVVAVTSVALLELVFPAIGFRFAPEAVAHAAGIALGAASSYMGHKRLTFRPLDKDRA